MTDRIRIENLEENAHDADLGKSCYQRYVQVIATLELARQQRETNVQLKRIADALDRKRVSAQAVDGPFDSAQDYGYDDLRCDHIHTGHQHDEPFSQIQDSRDSAEDPAIQ